MLTILAQRFPFFNSADDIEAMIEIATIFGQQRIRQCAMLHGAMFECTIPTVGKQGFPLAHIIQWSTAGRASDDGADLDPGVKDAVKFLEQCLELDPRRRISARAALAHDFLAEETFQDTEPDEMNIL